MRSVLENIAVGLLTSFLGGAFVWLWERAKRTREVNRRARFFGVRPGQTCLVVLGDKYNAPKTTAYPDTRAAVELALLAGELGCEVLVESGNFRGGNGDRTEFCVGGPSGGANPRTGGHLTAHLPGVTLHPYDTADADSIAIEVDGEKYLYDRGNREHVLVAKFTPTESTSPVFLVCGQSALSNLAAIHYLRREFATVTKRIRAVDRFCILISVSDIDTYDHHRATLERDVTTAAFTV
ncbi:hypothetical protein [Streptomyces mobaraensis]|uniref:hypothetical protein n=1 Tax=Streptomyces mobaraensis TaxID=35621 RepID=UPI0018776340|nr:hypothetical protein [Streptomyces mobaraensis]